MKLYIIRHAQGEHNVRENYNIFDPELTIEGIKQCERASPWLQDCQLIIASTSTRTLQTAHHLFRDKKIYATDLLLEYNTGIACNCRKSLETQRMCFSDIDFDRYLVDELKRETTWEDGVERSQRVIRMLNNINHLGSKVESVALVTHCNFAETLIHCLNGKKVRLDNCQVYTCIL